MGDSEVEERSAEQLVPADAARDDSPPAFSSGKELRRYDSLDLEAGSVSSSHPHHFSKGTNKDWGTVMRLAFQSVGIVYGDIGTSPLYVYASTFTGGIRHEDDILGVLSLIFYTITLITLVKYVFIVLRANDNGDGGTFALYSLICRYAKVGLLPSQQPEDGEVSNYKLDLPSNKRHQRASKIKAVLENSPFAKYFLLVATMLGTSMVIGDGVLTPCISVLSAVGGIKEATDAMTEDRIVLISVIILVCLFLVQRFGTDKVGYSFAPIITVWFLLIAIIGVFNFVKYDPWVVKAINPKYIIDYFKRNGKTAWISLGGVVLCITGVEALFADVGHFTVRSVQISMCSVAFPSLVLAYTGQASYLRKHMEDVSDTFYKSIPGGLYWPMFVVAILAAVIASQAMISGTFSIIQQSLSLGCFPRVKVVHTSAKHEGQVYIPEINYILMLACVAVTASFKTTEKIGNAYGIAVVFVMTLTSALLTLIMIMIWKTHIILIILYIIVIGSVELVYLSSVLYKFDQGGYLPLAFAAFLITTMLVWNYVYRKRYMYELSHKVPSEKVEEIVLNSGVRRIPGIAFFYSELVQGVPPIFEHYVANVPALHSVLVFVSIKSLPISRVPAEERFLFRRMGSHDCYVFRCVARYGYKDARSEQEPFDATLVQRLKEFMEESWKARILGNGSDEGAARVVDGGEKRETEEVLLGRELELVEREWRHGVVHLLGENEVVAAKGAGLWKRFVIDYAYGILKRNIRQQNEVFTIPRGQLLKVGMTIEL
ncbi:potassium transporter 5-like [Phoenix dactylifera]|uniref:Potassium transporter n=1 Tax=Phoenix dactylifera TaxID=42345 RepID=A0A8B7CM79_PHODC|nr:potassium transporter 5-like [Phoenix dactylifera]